MVVFLTHCFLSSTARIQVSRLRAPGGEKRSDVPGGSSLHSEHDEQSALLGL